MQQALCSQRTPHRCTASRHLCGHSGWAGSSCWRRRSRAAATAAGRRTTCTQRRKLFCTLHDAVTRCGRGRVVGNSKEQLCVSRFISLWHDGYFEAKGVIDQMAIRKLRMAELQVIGNSIWDLIDRPFATIGSCHDRRSAKTGPVQNLDSSCTVDEKAPCVDCTHRQSQQCCPPRFSDSVVGYTW
jgi:hypothetical protein